MISVLTDTQLNMCLTAINKAYKAKEISNTSEQSLEIDKKLITFIFDKTLGRKGAWIPKSKLKVIFTDDEPA